MSLLPPDFTSVYFDIVFFCDLDLDRGFKLIMDVTGCWLSVQSFSDVLTPPQGFDLPLKELSSSLVYLGKYNAVPPYSPTCYLYLPSCESQLLRIIVGRKLVLSGRCQLA